jgi:hypothetical protein
MAEVDQALDNEAFCSLCRVEVLLVTNHSRESLDTFEFANQFPRRELLEIRTQLLFV